MNTPKKRWFYRSIGIVVLIVAIPLTVYLVQQQQEIRQRAQQNQTQLTEEIGSGVKSPWRYGGSQKKRLPVLSAETKTLISSMPYASSDCSKKPQGDADCNNLIDLSDVNYWQIDYEQGTKRFADFNSDGSVSLADYNIWRLHAGLPETSVMQKLSQKIGLGKLVAFLPWKLLPKTSWKVFAQTTNQTSVTNSTVDQANDIYQIVSQYGNQTYAVSNISPRTNQGQATYYSVTGQQILQVSDFLSGAPIAVAQVGSDTITVSQDATGPIVQNAQDVNGALLASITWVNMDSFGRSEQPQAVTIPSQQGFTQLSMQPNNAGIVKHVDNDGKEIENIEILGDGTLIYTNLITQAKIVANKQENLIITTIPNNLGGNTTYVIKYEFLMKFIETDSKGNVYEFVPLVGKTPTDFPWQMTLTNAEGIKTEEIVSDPMMVTKSTSPNPVDFMRGMLAFRRARIGNQNIPFTEAFQSVSASVPNQSRVVDAFVTVAEYKPYVLGASTGPTKAVLGKNEYTDTDNKWKEATFDVSGGQITVGVNANGYVESITAHGNERQPNGNVSVASNPGSTVTFTGNIAPPANGQEALSLLNSGRGTVQDTSKPIDTTANAPATPSTASQPAQAPQGPQGVPQTANINGTTYSLGYNAGGMVKSLSIGENLVYDMKAGQWNAINSPGLPNSSTHVGPEGSRVINAAIADAIRGGADPNVQSFSLMVSGVATTVHTGQSGFEVVRDSVVHGSGIPTVNQLSIEQLNSTYAGINSLATYNAAISVAVGEMTGQEAVASLIEQGEFSKTETGFSFTDGTGVTFNVTVRDDGTVSGGNENDGQGVSIYGQCVVGNCGSFLAGTPIDTPRGKIAIEKLKPGDTIYSFNEKTKKKELATFSELYSHEVEDYLVINNTIQVTKEHPFYVKKKKMLVLVSAEKLKKGDMLFGFDEKLISVFSVKEVKKKTRVYNLLTVSPNNNFYAQGVLVHNDCGSLEQSLDASVNSETTTNETTSETTTSETTDASPTDNSTTPSEPSNDNGNVSDVSNDQGSVDSNSDNGSSYD